jgi:HEAT repeat protein
LSEQPALRDAVAPKLDDKNYYVRSAAIGALGPLLSEEPALREAVARKLDDEDNHVRSTAIRTLFVFEEQRQSICNLLSHSDWRTRRDGALAFAERLAEASLSLAVIFGNLQCAESAPMRSAAIGALGPLLAERPALREAVARKLDDESFSVRSAAIGALGPLLAEQPALRDAVARKFDDENYYVRIPAIRASAPLLAEHPALRDAVAGKLDDENYYVRSAAIGALGPLLAEHPALREAVARKLDDESYHVRSAAIGALEPRLAEHAALREAVVRKLDDESYYVRSAAIDALGPFVADSKIRGLLKPALQIDDQEISRRGLSLTFPRQALVGAWGRWLADEPTSFAEVCEMLVSEDSRLRQSGAEILSAAGKEAVSEAVPQLLQAADDRRGLDSWPARIAAAELLINDWRYSRDAIDTLMPALEYGAHPLVIVPDAAEIRKSAALALGKLKADEYRPEVAKRLEELLESERDPQVLNGLFSALHSLASAPG